MAEEKTPKTEEANVNHAKVGETINVVKGEQKGKKGEVITVRENSVIIKIGENSTTGEPIKTVVNHKNYKRVK
ncbi:DUF2187 domain-containing protein [Oceanobacillus zhaokaii]|uniref:DUF2187 domain-containing protein n=1 Tax=Oceanobacillus zhaokaii TaxID=2052660 RepID=A0A345PJJ5_9BACI|nr:DUF2187 family protein [Oceanobacillus zhaokaii]AXI10175.1 DUF2187 domain-containing protein [Oceanobacillus zhaokaii]